jgi:signal transduction histidine kinase/CheY-like chemotaxis protein
MNLWSRQSAEPAEEPVPPGLPRWLALALDRVPASAEDAAFIRGAQVHAIVRLSPVVSAATCINAATLLAVLWSSGTLRAQHIVWAVALFVMSLNYLRVRALGRDPALRPGSRRAIRRVVLNGVAYGAIWAVVPAAWFDGAPLRVQLIVACLTAGMMAGGAFVLATVPMAAMAFVAMLVVGSLFALLHPVTAESLGVTALVFSYAAVLVANINWSAALFVDSRLAEGRVRREVAAREQAQARAAHAERMRALGELAGGVAHDINNILQVVSGSAARIERRPENALDVARHAGRIQEAVDRGSAISRRLLAFARRDALREDSIDATALLAEVGELLADVIGPSINIRIAAPDVAGSVLADRRQLETVLLNLATNARDAMPDGGELTISATRISLDEACEARRLARGRYLRLAVADTGVGIQPQDLSRVAEPFFTTKPRGKGTGLGLSMAKGFAEQSGGALEIESQPGRGTTVTLWLPETEAAAPQPASDVTASDSAAAVHGAAGRRVLVVDDDEQVREGLMSTLQDAGFVTLGAEDARAALGCLDAGARLDAVITDFSMPGLNGLDLIHAAHARRPGLPAILLTGYLGDVPAEAFHSLEGKPFALLLKPAPPARVVAQLADLLTQIPA